MTDVPVDADLPADPDLPAGGDPAADTDLAQQRDVAVLARGGALNVAGAVVSAVGGFALYVVLTRGLGQAAAGAFIATIAIFNILAIAGSLGADAGLVWSFSRSIARSRTFELRRILAVAIAPVSILGTIFAVTIWWNAPSIASGLGGEDHVDAIASYLRVLAPLVPVASIYFGLLGGTRGFTTMVPTVTLQYFGRGVIQPVVAWVVIALGAGTTALALGWVAPFVIGAVAASLWLARLMARHPVDGTPRPFGLLAVRFWRFTAPRAVAAMFRVGVQWIDIVIVGAIMTPADTAIYAVATRLLQFGLFVASSVGQIAQPMFGGLLASGEKERTAHVYRTATGWQVAVTWPQYIVAALFAGLLLQTIFGDGYDAGATVVAILALSTMIGAAAGPVDMLLLMAGKSTWSLWNAGATLATNIGLNLILIPEFGITGAAIAWAVSRFIANALPLAQIAGHLKLHPFGRGTLLAGAGSLAIFGGIGGAAWLVDDRSLGLFAAASIAAVAIYAVFLRRFRTELALEDAVRALRRGRRRRAG